jgi:ribokinase
VRVAVVGHVEWIDFIRVPHVPAAGDIVHAGEWWEEPGGGGTVAAGQLAKLAGACTFYTALADDELGHRAHREIEKLGIEVRATFRPERQRQGVTFIDDDGERTITVMGERLAPVASDDLGWDDLAETDAVYVTAADREALKLVRKANVVTATSRILPLLQEAKIPLDALVGSAHDPAEKYARGDLDPPPRLVVRTSGEKGGVYWEGDGAEQPYRAAPRSKSIVDTYGAGDSFAAGLTWALGKGLKIAEAVEVAARCGAAVLDSGGPYAGQLAGGAFGPSDSN